MLKGTYSIKQTVVKHIWKKFKMTKNTLEKIIDNRIIEIEQRKKLVPVERTYGLVLD